MLTFCAGNKLYNYHRPLVAGILNVTSDSFFDGGRYLTEAAILRRAHDIVGEDGDIIDVGATSTRPGAAAASAETELPRLTAAVGTVREAFPGALVSADTYWAASARAAVAAGADIVNDIGGGADPAMFDTVAELQCPYVLTYNTAEDESIEQFFSSRLHQLYLRGVKDVWLDPGFGFNKSLDENYALLRRVAELHRLFDEPLYVGISRKSMIYKRIGSTPDGEDTLAETLRLERQALMDGAAVVRVHDVAAIRQQMDGITY